MSMHEKPTEKTPMTQAEILAQVVRNPESIVDPVDADLAKLHKRLVTSRTPEAASEVAPTSEGVAGAVVHSRGGADDGESHFGQLASEMVKVPVSESAASTGRTGSIDSQTTRGRRGKGRANPQAPAGEKPITPEKEPIRTGKYLDSAALLCEVYEQGGDFSYKVLEGKDEGQIIPVGDESRMRALMGDEWKKVDDATVPNLIDSAEPAEVKVAGLEQETPSENFELFQEGEMWTKEIEVDGKKGREFILIEKISGDTIEISRERQGVGFFENGKSESLDAAALTKVLQEEGFEFEKGDLPTAPEKEPILTGKYRNDRGELCEIFQEGKDFYYRILEGEYNNGSAFLVDNVNRAIIDDKWTKVADDTQASTEGSQETAAASGIDIKLPQQETERVPFLSEEGRIYRFTGNSRMSQDLRLVRERDRYYFLDTEDLKLPNDEGSTEEHIRELAVTEEWRPVSDVDSTEKSPVDIELPLGEAQAGTEQILDNVPESGEFSMESKRGHRTNRYKKSGDAFLNEKTGKLEEKSRLLELARNGWQIKLLAAEQVVPEAEKTEQTPINPSEKPLIEPEEDFGESQFVPLKSGETAYYRGNAGEIGDGTDEFFVRKEGWRYYVGYVDPKSEASNMPRTRYYSLKEVHALAKREQWVPYNPETDPPVQSSMPKMNFEEPKSELDELRAKVQEERFAYVETDYLQNSAWSKIKNILRLGEEREDVDTQSALQMYKNALMQLQEAELELVKKSGLSGDQLKQRLAGILMYVKYNEEAELMRARNQVRIQKQNKWEKAVAQFEEVGRWYNGLSRTTKFAAAAGFGGLALAGGAIGGGSAAVVTGVLFVKRAVAGAGLAITLDTLAEGILDKRRLTRAKKETEEGLDADYRTGSTMRGQEHPSSQEEFESDFYDLLKNNIQLQTEDLDKRFKSRKREALLRRSGAWATAAVATLGYSAYRSWFGGESTPGAAPVQGPDASQSDLDQALKDLKGEGAASAESGASAPASATSAASAPEAAASTAGQGASPLPTPEPAPAVAEAVPGKVGTLLEIYDVTSADGKKGLWGIFEQRLPAGFDGDKNKAIQSLNNLVAEKVKDMSPDKLKEVGLRTNDISKIYPGDKIDFSKLLTREEIQSVLDGKSVAAPAVSNEVIERVTAKVTETAPQVLGGEDAVMKAAEDEMIAQDRLAHGYTPAEQAALNAAEDQMIADSKAAELTPNAVRTAAAETMKAPSNPFELKSLKVFLQENPDRIPEFKNTLGGIRQVMFETPDVNMMNPSRAVYFDYRVQPMMGRVDMLRVLEYSRDLRTGALQEYAFNQSGGPIHTSQIRQLANLVQVVQDPKLFGTFGQVMRGENIDEYTRRIAALATATNKAPQLAMMLTGRAQRII